MFSIIFLNLVHLIRKCVKCCTDRQARDCNVTCCIVIPHWIIKSAETHSQNVPFDPFLRKNNYSHVSQRYTTRTLHVGFCFIFLLVPGGSECIMLRHFNRCLTFVIMCCVEECCDMHL